MRPKLENPKNVVIALRITQTENSKLEKLAKKHKTTKASLIQKKVIVELLNDKNNG